ncbi:sugar phosphate isomerase/epimerase family protein [Microbacterium hominis]|uniref:Sugar phosphate isomerase/epimerase n=1 Tax=Microbacterium hominis TaxID=162426 RepID=A0A7D4QB48_9MICO|nr:sugar phosphate isomerase/epimerase [Microbacterium hominis]QKJ18177.1 sugar phosphate isomerase/epimerase [Microbacterium hominis]
MTRIGVQAMMLKESFATDGVFETLKQVSEIGYSAFEISQVPMTPENVDELDRARQELGVEMAALSAMLTAPPGMTAESLTDDFDKIVADCRRLDATKLRIGMLPFDAMASLDRVRAFCDATEEIAGRLADHGIGLYYHNHHIEFAKYDGRYMLDIIADRAPSVGLEIDVHWVQRGGLDPVSTLRKYGERVTMVHLKDYRIGQLPPSAFEALGKGDFPGFMAAFTGVVQFAEVGEGNLDFAGIIEESKAIGAEYLLVEQDDLYGRTPLECLQTSYDNLVALGYADLFGAPALAATAGS